MRRVPVFMAAPPPEPAVRLSDRGGRSREREPASAKTPPPPRSLVLPVTVQSVRETLPPTARRPPPSLPTPVEAWPAALFRRVVLLRRTVPVAELMPPPPSFWARLPTSEQELRVRVPAVDWK